MWNLDCNFGPETCLRVSLGLRRRAQKQPDAPATQTHSLTGTPPLNEKALFWGLKERYSKGSPNLGLKRPEVGSISACWPGSLGSQAALPFYGAT